jgi:hypothetical protein
MTAAPYQLSLDDAGPAPIDSCLNLILVNASDEEPCA